MLTPCIIHGDILLYDRREISCIIVGLSYARTRLHSTFITELYYLYDLLVLSCSHFISLYCILLHNHSLAIHYHASPALFFLYLFSPRSTRNPHESVGSLPLVHNAKHSPSNDKGCYGMFHRNSLRIYTQYPVLLYCSFTL